MNDLVDVERNMPGWLKATIRWFRKYKIPEGKPENKFAFDGEPQNATFARHIVKEVHESWKNLMEARNTSHGIDRTCSKCGFRSEISTEDAKCVVDMAPETGIQGEAPSVTQRYQIVCSQALVAAHASLLPNAVFRDTGDNASQLDCR